MHDCIRAYVWQISLAYQFLHLCLVSILQADRMLSFHKMNVLTNYMTCKLIN